MQFIQEHGSWDERVKPDLVRLLNHYKSQGYSTFGIFGMCWGGKMAARAVCELGGTVGAAVLIHPSMLTEEDAMEALAPLAFLPSHDESDKEMKNLCQIVRERLGENNVEYYRFGHMQHGFCGARGDWTVDEQRAQVEQAIKITHSFFEKHLGR